LPSIKTDKANHVLEQRAFAAAGTTQYDKNLALLDLEIDIFHHNEITIGNSDIFDSNYRFCINVHFA